MREVIAVCRSTKRARTEVARTLDRYFWRIGDRTWRGKASNACLDRVSRELRKKARRNTAVVIHEIRSAHKSRVPIVRIGAKHAFSKTGIAPVSSHPARLAKSVNVSNSRAVVRIAALFHDLGKATNLFQDKLDRALKGGRPEADAVRHELHSAAVWDHLFGEETDNGLAQALLDLTPEQIDRACEAVPDVLASIFCSPEGKLPFSFLKCEDSLSHAIGMLILTHHRLPDGDSDLVTSLAKYHVRRSDGDDRSSLAGCDPADMLVQLKIAPGIPFWHESWWRDALHRDAGQLQPGTAMIGIDMFPRTALMMGDHLGSSEKKFSDEMPDHLANTIWKDGQGWRAADSLSQHVRRVHSAARHGVDLFEQYANGFPALDEGEMPADIAFPITSETRRYQWQAETAKAAHALCEANEGGFFACLMAGTGTGKTRGAPTILAAAAFGDTRPERQYFRMNLGLGLRVLATQSADEYVSDLGFSNQDISVLVGQAPLVFSQDKNLEKENEDGSESLIDIPDWLKVEMATGGVPKPGDKREKDWLRSLSLNTGKGLPAFCERWFSKAAGSKADTGRRLLAPPIMVGTIDHLMDVATPLNSRYILQSLRVATADLILDEIDQFGGEDIAAIGRLVYQTAVAGRRVIIMSATLTPDIASALHTAYRHGWSQFAAVQGLADHVNLLVAGDAHDSCRTNAQGESLEDLLKTSTEVTLRALATAKPARRAEILPVCDDWQDMVDQIDDACHRLHDLNAVELDGFRVSFGMVRMTRIAHVAALAAQLPSGKTGGCIRVMLCLHSQFPRLHRDWLETRLKRALTRKNDDPDFGLQKLCYDEKLFSRANEMGVRNIEIVLVTSPVIETGNDLDFDWAILDPISTRSIIQAAGRVRRHRPVNGIRMNVMILGRSPIAMQTGKLKMPGVETRMPGDTKVATPSLSNFDGRRFEELAGEADFSVINAKPILERDTDFPLRNAENDLRGKLVAAGRDSATEPLGRYIRLAAARMTRGVFRMRRFRRSVKKSILVACVGEDFGTAEWHMDLAPGTYQSKLRPVDTDRFHEHDVEGCHLFDAMTERAWQDWSEGRTPTFHDVKRLMRVEIPDYGLELEPRLTYTDFTGFTRGTFEDLFGPFGKFE